MFYMNKISVLTSPCMMSLVVVTAFNGDGIVRFFLVQIILNTAFYTVIIIYKFYKLVRKSLLGYCFVK